MANRTFSAYLYHVPLIVLAAWVFDLRGWVALAAAALGIAVLAQVTECQLPTARRWTRRVLVLSGLLAGCAGLTPEPPVPRQSER